WAFGDEIAKAFIFCAFMVPTFFLLWVGRDYEPLYFKYAQVVVAISVTAPLCLAMLATSILPSPGLLYDTAVMRLWRSPAVFILLVLSRVLARPTGTRRLINIA